MQGLKTLLTLIKDQHSYLQRPIIITYPKKEVHHQQLLVLISLDD
jgi:hypothetical protein